jgi:hypothetical protein
MTPVNRKVSHYHDGTAGGILECRGATIVEVVAYLAVLAVIMNFCAMIFVHTLRMASVGEKALDTIRAVQTIRADFTSSVREASHIAPAAGEYVTGESRIVLAMPRTEESPGAERFVVFSSLGEGKLVKATIAEEDGEIHLIGIVTYPATFERIHFVLGGMELARAKTATLELQTLRSGPQADEIDPIVVVAALRAPGGNGS